MKIVQIAWDEKEDDIQTGNRQTVAGRERTEIKKMSAEVLFVF